MPSALWLSVLVALFCSASQHLSTTCRDHYAPTAQSTRFASPQAAPKTTNPERLTEKDTILVSDFTNLTGLDAFDSTLDLALRTALEESPFLSVLSGRSVAATLKNLGNPETMPMTPEVSRVVCQRTHSKAYVSGSISRAGAAFVVDLQAVDCDSGEARAQSQTTAQVKDKVLDAVGEAVGKLRLQLGEAPESVRKFSTPLSVATSLSFEALRAWSAAIRAQQQEGVLAQGSEAALPLLEKAVKLDPDFASALFSIGLIYRDALQESRAREFLTRAFAVRQRSSVPQRFRIDGMYYSFVAVQADKTEQTYREWIKTYPRDEKPVSNLGSFYGDICRYPESIALFRRAREMNPANVIPHEDLIEILTAVGEFEQAKAAYQEMLRMKLDDDAPHLQMYSIAFLQRDSKELARQTAWFDGKAELQHEILASEADGAAYEGHLARARELTEHAVQAALHAKSNEQAAGWLLNGAWREEMFGNTQAAHEQTERALSIAPDSREGTALAAILLARSGDVARATALLLELEKRYPLHFMMQSYWLPTIHAQIALAQKQYDVALGELQKTLAYDNIIPQVNPYSPMPSVVARAEAYSASGHLREAEKEWNSIVNSPGIVQLSATAPIARLRLARIYADEAKTGNSAAREIARVLYQDFLSLWKDADAEIPALKDAKVESASLR